jgi:hypothetical protein
MSRLIKRMEWISEVVGLLHLSFGFRGGVEGRGPPASMDLPLTYFCFFSAGLRICQHVDKSVTTPAMDVMMNTNLEAAQ